METETHYNHAMPWVIFRLMNEMYALSAGQVREMVQVAQVTSVPGTPSFYRGVLNLRGKVIPVLDLRVKVGLPSAMDEIRDLTELLNLREEDHKNWMAELEASVREKREFTLTTDPHQCAFGKWYDTFTTDNRCLEHCLKKFDIPHKRIHAIGVDVKSLQEQGAYDQALSVIEKTRTTDLARMIELFDQARVTLATECREIAIVVEYQDSMTAIAVDAVETIERIPAEQVDTVAKSLGTDCVSGIARRTGDRGIAHLLDIGQLGLGNRGN